MTKAVVSCLRCRRKFEVYPSALKVGRGRYCGKLCMYKSKPNIKHGASYTRLYQIWLGMKQRCHNPNSPMYRYYGARGIAVCQKWLDAFAAFKKWAEASGYSDKLELDRRDNDKGYCPSNCRWATRRQQMANQRKRSDAETSRFKGVSWCANSNRWRAQGHKNGRPIHLGLFKEEADAAKAYDRYARRRYRDFAKVNFTG